MNSRYDCKIGLKLLMVRIMSEEGRNLMNRYTLTVVDTTGIQDYIFGTNQLKQNVGASYLVDCATRKWVVESLPEPNNLRVKDLDDLNPL